VRECGAGRAFPVPAFLPSPAGLRRNRSQDRRIQTASISPPYPQPEWRDDLFLILGERRWPLDPIPAVQTWADAIFMRSES